MLAKSRVCASVAARDLEIAKRFYAEIFELPLLAADERRGVYFHAATGTLLNLYEHEHRRPEQSVATFWVEDLDAVMGWLRERQVAFEAYEQPGPKTHNRRLRQRNRVPSRVVQRPGRKHLEPRIAEDAAGV